MTRKPLGVLATALLGLLLAGPAMSADLYVAGGRTSEDSAALKLEIDRHFNLHDWHPQLSLRLATGVLLLSSETESDEGNAAWLFTPALRYTFAGERRVFIEGGIGASIFLDTHVDDRELSTAFQFEDRLALGMPLATGELNASITHYSNAGIQSPNDGFEVFAVGYRFPL
ncbi:acyloxyacyl hydrolase [Litchfieldella xinjiangensis]|uniref:acyloxyacyl hydrolase n=1 Tax=Litchfieldella xinjiangensis TaxID=1166948 RepID=UPI0005BA23D3|nr:acyloxyacyl hydrolase [Halomonas xinjiangensis]